MEAPDFFFNSAGRLRSLWRLAVFTVAFITAMLALWLAVLLGLPLLLPKPLYTQLVESNWGFVLQSVIIFFPALLAGWACCSGLEDLPLRSLGFAPHDGWARDLLVGSLVGAAGIGLALALGAAAGSYRVEKNAGASLQEIGLTLAASSVVLMLGAAAEEMLFRGYALQTLLRSWPVWLALLPTSIAFALVHLDNPNVAPGFTLANTVLAGVWLAVGYWRTRSLWFPLGLHWGWNFAMGPLIGSPVSGITELAAAPPLRTFDAGPAWLGGGAYGIEGGAICTLVMAALAVFTWRTRLVKATYEMRQFTDGESPNPRQMPFLPDGRNSRDGQDKETGRAG